MGIGHLRPFDGADVTREARACRTRSERPRA
jgi:hypothetical protein